MMKMVLQNGQTLLYLNDGGNSVLCGQRHHDEGHQFVTAAVSDAATSSYFNYVPSERFLYVDENGILQEGLANLGSVILSQELSLEDDGEPP
jgi:hypothetical protein